MSEIFIQFNGSRCKDLNNSSNNLMSIKEFNIKRSVVCLSLLLSIGLTVDGQTITLSAKDNGRAFEGIGAVSAGASSRNLVDYPQKQRSEILDFLFKPKFGAGFQHLKVEIGSGENSTCGSEPSHAITREELSNPIPRGYEFWLMSEARKRNSKIILDCLPWAYPRWVGSRFSQASADWIVSFLELAKRKYSLDVNWISAAQNEMGTDLKWVANNLRPTLNKHGFSQMKLQAPDDDSEFWQIFDKLEKDPKLDKLINAVGYHYIDGRDPWEIDQATDHRATAKAINSGKPLWASEEWSQSGKEWGGKGTLYLARVMNKLYSVDRSTKFEIWCPVDGIYDQIIWGDTGALQSDSPWSGHYTIWSSVWAIAHTTQFAEPGWMYMDGACGQFDANTWRGSHVALRNPKTGDWSLIIVTGEQKKVKLLVGDGLKKGLIHIWKSTEKEQFIEQNAQQLNNNAVELQLDSNAIYTITNTTGQRKGSFGTPPPSKPFPFPYTENFDSYKNHETPKFFSDQKGTFESVPSPKGGMCLAQVVPDEGLLWYSNWLLKPHSLFGDGNWNDYSIESDVLLKGGDVEIGGRYAERDKLGYRWILTRDGRWQLNWQYTILASGQIREFVPGDWHHLKLEMVGDEISGIIDGKKLAIVASKLGGKGMAFVASTYDRNLFDNIKVTPKDTK